MKIFLIISLTLMGMLNFQSAHSKEFNIDRYRYAIKLLILHEVVYVQNRHKDSLKIYCLLNDSRVRLGTNKLDASDHFKEYKFYRVNISPNVSGKCLGKNENVTTAFNFYKNESGRRDILHNFIIAIHKSSGRMYKVKHFRDNDLQRIIEDIAETSSTWKLRWFLRRNDVWIDGVDMDSWRR